MVQLCGGFSNRAQNYLQVHTSFVNVGIVLRCRMLKNIEISLTGLSSRRYHGNGLPTNGIGAVLQSRPYTCTHYVPLI